MEIVFADKNLDHLEIDPQFTANLSQALIKSYRKKIQAIRAAQDERDFYQQRSFNFEPLKGKRKGQYSIRLNDQYRLVFEFVKDSTSRAIRILGIEDYHH